MADRCKYPACGLDDGKPCFSYCPAMPSAASSERVAMLLFCPRCQKQHVDAAEPEKGWTNPPHATHTCKFCGLNWRPSNVNTDGVESLPTQEIKHIERMAAADPRCYAAPADADKPFGYWDVFNEVLYGTKAMADVAAEGGNKIIPLYARSATRVTPQMVEAVNALEGWSGFTQSDLQLLVDTMRAADRRGEDHGS